MRKKKIICYELGEIYESTRQAERKLNISDSDIVRCANGEYSNTHGLHFRYLDDLADCFIEEPEEEYDDSFEEEALNEIFNQLNKKKEESELEKALEKVLIPLSIKIGVEVEKSIIDVLEHLAIKEEIDERGHYILTFDTMYKF